MSAEKVSKLEQMLARISERRDQPATRLRIVSDAEVEAPVAEAAPVVEVAGEATLLDATPAPAEAAEPEVAEPEVAESVEPPEATTPPPLPAEPSEPEVAEVEISAEELDGVDLDADAEALFEPEDEDTSDAAAEAPEDEIVVEETMTSHVTPATERSEPPPVSEEAVTVPRPLGEAVPPTKVTLDEPATSEVDTEKRPAAASGPPPMPARATEVSGTATDALNEPAASTPLELTRRQDELAPSKPVELVNEAVSPVSDEVDVSVPAAPDAAASLGEVEPVVVKPVRLSREDVADFVTQVAKPSGGSFGELIDAALELRFN